MSDDNTDMEKLPQEEEEENIKEKETDVPGQLFLSFYEG